MESNLPSKRQLPKIEDLYGDLELASQYNDLNKLLNSIPKKDWVKQNPFANNSNYIPIGIIEYLLTSIFLKWWVEVKAVQVIANSIVVTVRLYVLDPITGDSLWQDGVGAAPIQTAKGAAATDFEKVNTSAVQMSAPAAESYAVKDAAEKFGKIFGKDLNRKDEMNYMPMMETKFGGQEIKKIPDELIEVISITTEPEKLTELYEANAEYHSNPKFMQYIYTRKMELNGK